MIQMQAIYEPALSTRFLLHLYASPSVWGRLCISESSEDLAKFMLQSKTKTFLPSQSSIYSFIPFISHSS